MLRLYKSGGQAALSGFRTGSTGHIDVPTALAGGLAGGMFAIFVPDDGPFDMAAMLKPEYDLPLPDPLTQPRALDVTLAQASLLLRLAKAGDVALCTTASDIRAAMDAGTLAAVMHLEGAEAIGENLAVLDVLYAAGLRSIGPVWSRPTIFGHGVPFRFPATGDTGPGLTDAGKALARRCLELGMVFDTSHLTEKGFWDAGELGLPLVATHSNAHAICPHARNLTDTQLRAVGESGGMVGLNFAGAFLRPDGQMRAENALEWMVRHLDHMIEHAGEDHVGLGSDFDGAVVPAEIGSAAGLDALRDAMRAHGYDDALMTKLCHGNWLAALSRIWGG